ncbi:hypothetical protein D3C78_914110 [compost metagenome]
MNGALDDGVTEHEHRQHEVVHRQVVAQVEHPEQLAARHAVQAVLTTGERRLYKDEEHQLCQRQGDHREVDALATDRQQTEQQPQNRRGQGPGENPQFSPQATVVAEQEPGDIATGREKRGMTKGQQSGVAQQQVEGTGEQGKTQQLHQEHRVHRHGCHQRDGEQRQIEPALAPNGCLPSLLHHLRLQVHNTLLDFQTCHLHASFPNSPTGRTSSTSTMTRNTTVLAASG